MDGAKDMGNLANMDMDRVTFLGPTTDELFGINIFLINSLTLYVLAPALILMVAGFFLRKLHASSTFAGFYEKHPVVGKMFPILCILSFHIIVIVFSIIFIFFIFTMDNFSGFSLFQNRNYMITGLIFLIFYGTIPLLFRKKSTVIYLILYIICFVSLPFTSFVPTKPLFRSYYRFEQGMTVEEITGIMQEEFGKSGFKTPTLDHVREDFHFYLLDPDDGSWDWYWIHIYFKDNRYQRTEFYPD